MFHQLLQCLLLCLGHCGLCVVFFLLHIVRIHCLRSTVAQLAAVAFVRFIHYALRHDCSSVLWSYQLWPAIQLTRIPALNRSASIHKNKRGLVATKRFLISVTSVQAVSTSPSVRQCWYSLLHCIRRSPCQHLSFPDPSLHAPFDSVRFPCTIWFCYVCISLPFAPPLLVMLSVVPLPPCSYLNLPYCELFHLPFLVPAFSLVVGLTLTSGSPQLSPLQVATVPSTVPTDDSHREPQLQCLSPCHQQIFPPLFSAVIPFDHPLPPPRIPKAFLEPFQSPILQKFFEVAVEVLLWVLPSGGPSRTV